MKKILIGSVLAGIAMFFWGFVSWAVLSWHQDVSLSFNDESVMAAAIAESAPEAGIYFLPFTEEGFVDGGPSMFASIVPEYHFNMGMQMGLGVLGYIVSALLVAMALGMTKGLSYSGRLKFVLLLGLIIGAVGHFPYWNWMNFPTPYVLVMIADTVLNWLLGGLILAKFVGNEPS